MCDHSLLRGGVEKEGEVDRRDGDGTTGGDPGLEGERQCSFRVSAR